MTITHHIHKPMAFGAGDTTCGLEVTPRIGFSVTKRYVNCPDCINRFEEKE